MRSLLRPLLALQLLLAAFPAVIAAQSLPSLLGEWRLLEFNRRDATGTLVPIYGPKPIGILVYTASGRMSAHLFDERRAPLDHADLQQVSQASAARAFRGLATYFGTYTVDTIARTVTHLVEGAHAPNWIGSKLVRGYRFATPNRLELVVLTDGAGRPVTSGNVVVWERIPE